MSEAVRAAVFADVAAMADVARSATEELLAEKGGWVWSLREARVEPYEDSLATDLGDPAVYVVAGTYDDVVVGYGAIRREVLRVGALLGIITDVAVLPGARGVGIGDAMVGEMVARARQWGCVGIDSLALPGARETKNFFEAHGFTARAIVVHHRLESHSDLMEDPRIP